MDLCHFALRRFAAQRREDRRGVELPRHVSYAIPRALEFYRNECRKPLPADTEARKLAGILICAQASITTKPYPTGPVLECVSQRPNKRHAELSYQPGGTEIELDTPKLPRRQRGRPRKYGVGIAICTM